MSTVQLPHSVSDHEHVNKQVGAIGWGALFIWVGVATLLQVGWGFGLLGVGVIILGAEVAHVVFGRRRLDLFSAVVGLAFLLGGIWELFSFQGGLIPILFIAAGVVFIVSAMATRPTH